jgi:predicted dehydrogenase
MSIRWGFLGAGFVASRGLAPAVHEAANASLFAVASRDPSRSAALEPTRVHASYDDLLADDEVDAVYISLANHQHLEWVVKSLEAGKHVLCEKPLGLRAAEVAAMFEVAEKHDRLLVEAVWARWHPRFRRMVDVVVSGSLGNLEHIDSSFTFTSEMTDNYRLNPTMGGGALLDVGCYQVHAWVALTGGAPDLSLDRVDRLIGPTGVDMTTEVTARMGTTSAHALASFALSNQQQLTVRGAAGEMRTGQGESFTTWNEPSSLHIGEDEEVFASTNAFVVMVENVSNVSAGRDGWIVPAAESVRVASILDDIAALH